MSFYEKHTAPLPFFKINRLSLSGWVITVLDGVNLVFIEQPHTPKNAFILGHISL